MTRRYKVFPYFISAAVMIIGLLSRQPLAAADPAQKSTYAGRQKFKSVDPDPDSESQNNRALSTVKLAAEGRALIPIVLAPHADAVTEGLARDLAAGLERITGAKFEIRREEMRRGIILGTDRDWKGIVPATAAGLSPLLTREDYVLRTVPEALFIVGREPIGLQDAIWDFLYRLGFRQFFPGPNWEVWPREPKLSVAIDVTESPHFYQRAFAFTGLANSTSLKKLGVIHAAADLEARDRHRMDVEQWAIRNRLVSGFDLQYTHAYGAIVRRNPDHFAANPQDIVPRESGETRKLDPSRSTVLDIVAQDALRQFEEEPSLDSVSVEPSDGGGWRTDSPLGRPTNQALTLANHVAKAVRAKYPGRKVGMLAYNEHSPPPDFDVDPDVVVAVATLFLRGGYNVDQAIDGWRARKADVGIREYLALYGAGRDYPGRTRADDLDYIVRTIPHFYDKGARYWKCEASRAWVPHGLGYYLTCRLLWNTADAERVAEIKDDFYHRAFEPAAEEMRQFHERFLLAQGRPLLSEDLIGRMYRLLQTAFDKVESTEVTARLVDYVAYVRYLELALAVENGPKSDRNERVEDMDRFVYRFRNSPVINSGGYYRELARSGREGKPEAEWRSDPLSSDDALEWIRRGIVANRVNSFEPVSFSTDLVPWFGPADEYVGAPYVSLVQTSLLHLYADNPGRFTIEVEGNLLYDNRGPVRLRLFAGANPLVDQPVAEAEVPADKPHTVTLASPFIGLHRLEISDGGAGTKISWPAGQRIAVPVTPEPQAKIVSNYKYDGVFYVPKGTKVVAGYSVNSTGKILLPDGSEALDLKTTARNSYFAVQVPDDLDGQCWRVKGAMRGFLLLTVPPYLARSSSELLVPAEALKNN